MKKLRRQRHCRRRRRRIRFSRRSIGPTTIARFAQAPASADDFHVARPRGLRLDTVFRLEEDRTVSNDWVVRYDNRFLQLERQSGHAAGAQHRARCAKSVDGHLEIRYRDRVMRWTEIAAGVRGPRPAVPAPPRAPPRQRRRRARRRVPADHPWRHGFKQIGDATGPPTGTLRRSDEEPVEAAGAVDAKSTRPPLLGKLQNSFPRASTGIVVTSEGDISIELRMGTFLTSLDTLPPDS